MTCGDNNPKPGREKKKVGVSRTANPAALTAKGRLAMTATRARWRTDFILKP